MPTYLRQASERVSDIGKYIQLPLPYKLYVLQFRSYKRKSYVLTYANTGLKELIDEKETLLRMCTKYATLRFVLHNSV